MKIRIPRRISLLGTLLTVVPAILFAQTRPAPAPNPNAPVNVNTASEAELRTLPGIGREEARRVIAGRPYRDFESFAAKAGLRPDSREAIAPHVRFEDPAGAHEVTTGRAIHVDPNSPPLPPPPARPPSERLDVNTAPSRQLAEIPHLAPYVSRIIQMRPYKNLGELSRAGVPRQTVLQLSRYIKAVPPSK